MNNYFPQSVDSTIIGSFRSCPRKCFLNYLEHWKPKQESVHLVAGGAFASALEAARKAFFISGMSVEDSQAIGLQALLEDYGDFECPPESAKSLERMCGALEYYFEHYPLGNDGAEPITMPGGYRGIELNFAHPLPISHPITGDPILYTGRSDMIAEFAGGTYIFDEKTTTSLGPSWARQWDMRSQFTGYCWASRESGIPVNGAIIRGVAILKTKFNTQQVMTYRADWEIDRWFEQLCKDLERMIQLWKSGYWDYNLDHACTEYGGCTFTQICKSPDPESWLETYFERRIWDPLAHKEISYEEWETNWKETLDAIPATT